MPRTAVGLLLTIFTLTAPAEKAREITVHLFDLAGAPESSVTKAMEITSAAFRNAGVSLHWVREPESFARLAGGQPFHHETVASELSIWLMPPPATKTARTIAATADTAADYQSRYQVLVTYERVKSVAGVHPELQVPAVLGLVFSHELGHLFLGPGAHERGTIMTPRWEKEDFRAYLRGQLGFNARQSAQLRANAAARIADAKPAQVSLGGSVAASQSTATSSSDYSRTQ